MPFISIVVPFRNARENIRECAESLLNQNYPKDRYEIIMVDNMSTYRGAAVLAQYKNLILLEDQRCGSYAARNKGISVAKGEIIACTDSDCVADPDWLKKIAGAFGKETTAVAGEIKAYKPTTVIEVYWEGCMKQEANLSDRYPYAITANLAFRNHVFDERETFDPSFLSCGDVDLCWRLLEKGCRIEYEPAAVVYHKNIKTRYQVFKKIFFQSSYVPKAIKKNLKFLEHSGKMRRVAVYGYVKLLQNIFTYLFAGKDRINRHKLSLEIVPLTARKLGLIYGSLRHGFLYI